MDSRLGFETAIATRRLIAAPGKCGGYSVHLNPLEPVSGVRQEPSEAVIVSTDLPRVLGERWARLDSNQ